jgi:acyl-CoA synthetase (AMP-forming)/AMP-acid ligase II
LYLADHAARHPERQAVVLGDRALSYAELDETSNQLAHALAALGLGPGDVVAVMLPNSLAWAPVWWGVFRSGMYLTTINWHLTPAEISYILGNSGARVLVTSEQTAEVAAAAAHEHRGVVRLQTGGASAPGVLSYEDLVADQPRSTIARELAGGPMFYSSGTTGRPKGVRSPLPGRHPSDVSTTSEVLCSAFGIGDGDRYLCPAPLYHSGPASFSFGCQAVGATAVIMSRFDAQESLRLIQDQKVTVSQWVPTMFQRLLRLPDEVKSAYDLSTHRLALHAAAPCPPWVKRAMIEWWGPILVEYYGSTEVGATVITSKEWLQRPGSVGKLWGLDTPIAIIDPATSRPVPAGEQGLVYFEPLPSNRFAYHRDPDRTARAYLGPLATAGDIGYLDNDGYLYLTDRLSNMIISGGVNIYPQEIEHRLGEHPAVFDVAVFGVPDDEFGEQVKGVVQLAPGWNPSEELARELVTFCRATLASFKLPASVDFETELPRDDNGKLYKRRLRDRYWAGRPSRLV